MYFALTEDQRDFAGAVREFLADRFDIEAVRAVVEDSETGDGHPADLWRAMGEQGWLAVLVPEEHDGLGLGLVDAQAIARELGAGVTPGPWRGTVLAAEALRLAGTAAQRKQWLPRLAAGDAVGALALRPSGPDSWAAVEYAEVADVLVVADESGGLRLLRPEEVRTRRLATFDGTSRLAAVTLADSAGEPLPGATPEVLDELTARAAVLVAADLVGGAREALTRTVDYDRDRKQFGVPVGSFQALKHSLADLHVAVTLAEHAVLYAAHALDLGPDSGPDDRALAVAVAKAKAGDTALAVTGAMIQYHGGIGFTWEHEAHFFYKRAKRLAGTVGTPAEQRKRIAELTIG